MSKVPTSNDIMERDDFRVRYASSGAESSQCRQTVNDGVRQFVARDFLCGGSVKLVAVAPRVYMRAR